MGLGNVARSVVGCSIAFVLVSGSSVRAESPLLEHLAQFAIRLSIPLPSEPSPFPDGHAPKGIASGDLDGDGKLDFATCNIDGRVTVFYGTGVRGAATGGFEDSVTLETGAQTLRDIVIADLNNDQRADVAVAAPWEGVVYVFPAQPTPESSRRFGERQALTTWELARNLATGDFNGDGLVDLAVAGKGQGLRIYRGTTEGQLVATTTTAIDELGDHEWTQYTGQLKPLYPMDVYRAPGADRDTIVVTHTVATAVHSVVADDEGKPRIADTLSVLQGRQEPMYDLAVGELSEPHGEATGAPELVVIHRDHAWIRVYTGADGAGSRFDTTPRQTIQLNAAPRAVKIVDLDGDGWKDLVVVLRYRDRVRTYRNHAGVLRPEHDAPVGRSPRDLIDADFDGDGTDDVAIINRRSADVSVLYGEPETVGFTSLDQLYFTRGDASALQILDLNADGRDDVVQTHRASSELSVRLANTDGSLAPAIYYTAGRSPSALELADLDGDGYEDALIGHNDVGVGRVVMRPGDGTGKFGEMRLIRFPNNDPSARVFDLHVEDLDFDGVVDIAIGIYDCSGSHFVFLRGTGGGEFVQTNEFGLKYAHGMGIDDFDQDGDIDFAGMSRAGELAILETDSSVLTDTSVANVYQIAENHGDVFQIQVRDINNDADPDFLIGRSSGLSVLYGGEGSLFEVGANLATFNSDDQPASVITADINADGLLDLVVGCVTASCVDIYLGEPEQREFGLTLRAPVPTARNVGVGDLDGDGQLDLVGTGEVLWTALSSRPPEHKGVLANDSSSTRIRGVVINEVLAINNDVPLGFDENRKPDYIELYNGGDHPQSFEGWTLTLAQHGRLLHEWTFPAGAVLEPDSRLVLIASNGRRSPFHLGFRLPGEGGTLLLRFANGAIADEIHYAPQFANVAYGRYEDGVESLTYTARPTPGEPNLFVGEIAPEFTLESIDPPVPVAGEPVLVTGLARDELGVERVTLYWFSNDQRGEVHLFDATPGPDTERGADRYVATIDALPAGVVRFYVEVEDIGGTRAKFPEGVLEGLQFWNHVLVGEASSRSLRLSEVVALNNGSLKDETGGSPDWVEVTNCGDEPLSLSGLLLTSTFPAVGPTYAFPAETILAPGERLIVFCDGDTEEGATHAPFSLPSSGASLYLLEETEQPMLRRVVDHMTYSSIVADMSISRPDCDGEWRWTRPTPGQPNDAESTVARGDVDLSGRLEFVDGLNVLNYLFFNAKPLCPGAGDVNDDHFVNISDTILLFNYLFLEAPAPALSTPLLLEDCAVD